MISQKTFTRAELAAYNGQEGRPAYVAYKGRVIDVTASKMWRGGSHMKRHGAGQDLTEEIASAPHDVDVLDRFPQVGVLAEEPVPAPVPAPGAAIFLVTGNRAFETTALHCLGAALLFSLVVIPTSLLTWWVNYGAQPIRAVTVKIVLSLAQFVIGLAAFLWRLLDPEVAHHSNAPAVLWRRRSADPV